MGGASEGEGTREGAAEKPRLAPMRRAIDVWPRGLKAARMNATPLVLFVLMAMLFAGAMTRLGVGPVQIAFLWLAGVYAASIVFVAAYRTAASRGADWGMLALGGSRILHRVALRAFFVAAVGAALGFAALRAAVGPPVFERVEGAAAVVDLYLGGRALVASAGSVLSAAAFGAAFAAAGLLFGAGAGRVAGRGSSADAERRPGGVLRRVGAAALGPAPLAALAIWIELARPSAVEAGGYWTLEHAFGEGAVFAAAGLALVFAALAIEDGAPHHKASRGN